MGLANLLSKNLVYLGTRSGSIHRFDLRISEPQGSRGLFSNDLRSSVLHLQLINDMHFLSSYMNGQVCAVFS
jgi:WD repeat-containing protein 21A